MVMIVGVTPILPCTTPAGPFGLQQLLLLFLVVLLGVRALSIVAAAMAKKIFYARVKF
jgi:hypothetical protein